MSKTWVLSCCVQMVCLSICAMSAFGRGPHGGGTRGGGMAGPVIRPQRPPVVHPPFWPGPAQRIRGPQISQKAVTPRAAPRRPARDTMPDESGTPPGGTGLPPKTSDRGQDEPKSAAKAEKKKTENNRADDAGPTPDDKKKTEHDAGPTPDNNKIPTTTPSPPQVVERSEQKVHWPLSTKERLERIKKKQAETAGKQKEQTKAPTDKKAPHDGKATAKKSEPPNPKAISSLKIAISDLQTADHDYQGHRIRALDHVSLALQELGAPTFFSPRPSPNAGELPQAQSDQVLRSALVQMNSAKSLLGSGTTASSNQSRARGLVIKAIQEINTALAVR